MNLGEIESGLWILGTLLTCALLLRLWQQDLINLYRAFSAYLAWNIVSAVTLSFVPRATNRYAHFYFFFEIAFWILYVLTALELVGSVLRRYRGIASFSRRAVAIGISASVAVALLSMTLGIVYPDANTAQIIIRHLFLVGQVVSVSVLVFLLISAGFLAWFPVPLPSNAVRLFLGYTVVFAARTAAILAINTQGYGWARFAGAIKLAAVVCCTIYWIYRLKSVGESNSLVVAAHWQPEQERRLLQQLDSLNSKLTRK